MFLHGHQIICFRITWVNGVFKALPQVNWRRSFGMGLGIPHFKLALFGSTLCVLKFKSHWPKWKTRILIEMHWHVRDYHFHWLFVLFEDWVLLCWIWIMSLKINVFFQLVLRTPELNLLSYIITIFVRWIFLTPATERESWFSSPFTEDIFRATVC